MVANQSEMAEADFEKHLHTLSREMLRLCYLNRPVIFDWYYDDYLYTNVRFLALMVGECEKAKWMFPKCGKFDKYGSCDTIETFF
jgi:hypothetical protein